MLWKRLTLGPVLILVIFAGAWLDQWLDARSAPGWLGGQTLPPGIVVFVIVFLLAGMGAREIARLVRGKGADIPTWVLVVLAWLGLVVTAAAPESIVGDGGHGGGVLTGVALAGGVAAIGLLVAILESARDRRPEGTIMTVGAALLVYIYIGAMLGFLVAIRREHEIWVLVWVLLTTKLCDIGAYFTGRAVGRRKLIPWLSPGKTWEGLVGGVIVAGLGGWLGTLWLGAALAPGTPLHAPVWGGVAGVLFGLVGQGGDLFASALKRDAGTKDSGGSLPGFGGVLDLIDSPLAVGVVAFWWLRLVTPV